MTETTLPAAAALPEPEAPDHEDYRLSAAREVTSLLRGVIDRRALVTLHFRDSGGFIITSLLAINPQAGEMIFDAAQDPAANRGIGSAARLVFVTLVDNIKTQFETGPAVAITFEGHPAFRTRVPASVLRLQRRNHFRVQAPRAEPLVCEIPLTGADPVRFVIGDLSVGGVAMLAGPDYEAFKPGAIFHNCRIELPEHGVITTSLELRSQIPVRDAGARDARLRFGCRFLNLAGTVESLLQRYINHLERSRRALV